MGGGVTSCAVARPLSKNPQGTRPGGPLTPTGGRTTALRALLKAEKDRGAEFERVANALSALHPKGSEEKRLLDAMLLAMPR